MSLLADLLFPQTPRHKKRKLRHKNRKLYMKLYMTDYRKKHKEQFKMYHKRDYKKHKNTRLIRNREYARRRHLELKLKVLCHYGGNPPQCSCCSESEIKFLTIHHVMNNGKTDRGKHIYARLVRNKFPSDFEVLCFNCNCAKGFFGECPHKHKTMAPEMQ